MEEAVEAWARGHRKRLFDGEKDARLCSVGRVRVFFVFFLGMG